MLPTKQQMTDELVELYEQLPKGEWKANGNGVHRGTNAMAIASGDSRVAIAAWIAAAHNAFPVLIETLAEARKVQGDAVIDAHLLRVEVESLQKQLARTAPVEWGDDKQNFWVRAWKYHTADQCLEMCAARPEMALAYIDTLRAELQQANERVAEAKWIIESFEGAAWDGDPRRRQDDELCTKAREWMEPK